MDAPKAAKAAPACGKRPSIASSSGGLNNEPTINEIVEERQARRISRLFALSVSTAATIAGIVYAAGPK
jgi:hypothetical protein